MFRQIANLSDASALAHAIVDTVREPLVVLDQELRVVAASRSFCSTFAVERDVTEGRLFYQLGGGEWDIPELRLLLEKIVPEQGIMDGYQVEHDFPGIGLRTMLLNARKVFYELGSHTTVLLSIQDITAQRVLELEKDALIEQRGVLLEEMQHRIANSLQIIASIILLKAKAVDSEETRHHLQDTHKRVLSIAAVQQHLNAAAAVGSVEVKPYLSKLCEALADSLISENRPITIKSMVADGIATSRKAESIGLIVTELVLNALKHAFGENTKVGMITVAYEVSGTNWKLSVTDSGGGKANTLLANGKAGLGTGIIKALAKQLDAQVMTTKGIEGTTVSITHATFSPAAV